MREKTANILKEALEGKYAVGAFNTSNLEISLGIAHAAREKGKPCIIQTTSNALIYGGHSVMGKMIQAVIDHESNAGKMGFHLDHGKNFDDIMTAIEIGVDSVMIDASLSELKENIKITKRVVEYAHQKGVQVQAELGKVPYLGREHMDVDWDQIMTDPREAEILAKETGIDALAVGIGNAHGFYRERSEPDWKRLEEIKTLLPNMPLILHGASDWSQEKIIKAVSLGICCFNIDTDIRVVFLTEICKHSNPNCDLSDPRKVLGAARDAVQKKVEEKITLFRCGK